MKQQIAILVFGFLLILGILLTGSDSPWFPWPNALGLLATMVAALTAHKLNLNDDAQQS